MCVLGGLFFLAGSDKEYASVARLDRLYYSMALADSKPFLSSSSTPLFLYKGCGELICDGCTTGQSCVFHALTAV